MKSITSIINGIILPIDELICFRMVIAPPTGWGLMGHKVGNHWMIKVGNPEPHPPKKKHPFSMVQLWLFISYNWLFQWENKQSINGVLLVLITGISGHNCR